MVELQKQIYNTTIVHGTDYHLFKYSPQILTLLNSRKALNKCFSYKGTYIMTGFAKRGLINAIISIWKYNFEKFNSIYPDND